MPLSSKHAPSCTLHVVPDEALDDDVGGADDLAPQRIRRRPRERRLLLPDDGPRRRALAQELLDAVEEVVPLRLGDVEQRHDIAVQDTRPRRRTWRHYHPLRWDGGRAC